MDRIDAMRVFVSVLEEGSLAAAARRFGRSPAAVSRTIAYLEQHVGAQLLHRTTRSLKLSEVGERYAAACRRILSDLEEADMMAAGERAAPRGVLTVTAPLVAGSQIIRPLLDAFLDTQPNVRARLLLLDRPVNLIDEGVDVALRIAHLPDSSLVAIRVGEVRRVVCAAPSYLDNRPPIRTPHDLRDQVIVNMPQFGIDAWVFPPAEDSPGLRTIPIAPRLAVNTIESAVASAVTGQGVTRVFSYQVADHVAAGRLRIILADAEPTPLPVHVITPEGRLSAPKVRAFVDFVVPRLKAEFARRAEAARMPAETLA